MAEAFYRLKSAGGDWTRVTGTVPITVTGLTEGAVYEYLRGDSTIGEVTAGAAGTVVPSITASDSLSGRDLTISVDSLTGDPSPSVALTNLTLDAANVLGDEVGSDPWVYTVPDSDSSQIVAWTLEATNSGGSDTASGSTSVSANLFAPTATTAPTVSGTAAPGETVTLNEGTYSGTTPITITFTLTLDGADVTGDVSGSDYTIPAGTDGHALVYTETASNGIAPDATQSVTRTVQTGATSITTSTVTQDGITFTFDGTTRARQTADGAWVVEAGVSLISATPDKTGTGTALKNGLMRNPTVVWTPGSFEQAWDGRGRFLDETLEETSNLPVTLVADDIWVKIISSSDAEIGYPGDSDYDRMGYPKYSAALYVVSDIDALPQAPIMSPAPLGWEGRGAPEFWTIDAAAAVAALPEYDTTGMTNTIDFTTNAFSVERFQATATNSMGTTNGGFQAWLLYGSGSGSNYGQFVYRKQEPVALSLIGNEWTTEQKKTRLVQLASMGVHFLQLAADDPNYTDETPKGMGGLFQYNQIPVEVARFACPEATMPVRPFADTLYQPFQFNASMISDFTTPHSENFKPRVAFARTVQSVDTGANTVNLSFDYTADPFRFYTTPQMKMVATDGSHESIITTYVRWSGRPSSADVPVEDASGFAGKDVYFEAVSPFSAGDYWWKNSNAFHETHIEANVSYTINNNQWAGWALFTLAAGLDDADTTPGIRWTEQRAQGFRGLPDPFETSFAEEFWNAHEAAIFAQSNIGSGRPFVVGGDSGGDSGGDTGGDTGGDSGGDSGGDTAPTGSFPVMEATATYADFGEGHTIPLPAGIVAGDLLVIESKGYVAQLPGWDWNGKLFTRIADGTEGGGVSFSSTGNRIATISRRFSGASGVVMDGLNSGLDPDELVLSGSDNYLFVAFLEGARSDWSVDAPPTGYSGLVASKTGNSSATSRMGVASAYRTAATSSEDADAWTINGTIDSPLVLTYAVVPSEP